MNIFILDEDTDNCAKMHNDKHVVKMILETAQLLCGVHWLVGSEAPYRLSHKNHPCSIWARECIENYVWLCDLGMSLCREYSHRYKHKDGTPKRHKSQDIIEWCMVNLPNIKENGTMTEFALAMPDECKVGNAVESYREYYNIHKKDISTWKNREIPLWFKQ
jgi:hypothetical protein